MKTKEARQILEEFLKNALFEFRDIDVVEDDEAKEYYFNILADTDAARLIGRNGETLASIQHLLKNIYRHNEIYGENEHVKFDVDSYKKNQEENVIQMAEKKAKDVQDSGRNAVLPPMSPYFRRLVHVYVKDNYPDLVSSSSGIGSHRSVCISTTSSENGQAKKTDLYEELDL